MYWILKLGSLDRNSGYNLRLDTETGMETSQSTSEKIRENLKRQWAAGERSGHSDKMKKKWQSDPLRRKRQGEMFSKMRTKYEYKVTGPDNVSKTVLYKELQVSGLQNVLANFHRNKSNRVTCRGFIVERIPRGEA